jgi:hypothetical protein
MSPIGTFRKRQSAGMESADRLKADTRSELVDYSDVPGTDIAMPPCVWQTSPSSSVWPGEADALPFDSPTGLMAEPADEPFESVRR